MNEKQTAFVTSFPMDWNNEIVEPGTEVKLYDENECYEGTVIIIQILKVERRDSKVTALVYKED